MREELFITSKLWNTDHRKEHVKDACKKSMEALGLEYLDLYIIHFPVSLKYVPYEVRYPKSVDEDSTPKRPVLMEDPVPYSETWEAMEELVTNDIVGNIGCSNVNVQLLRDLLSYAHIKPALLEVEMHPYLS